MGVATSDHEGPKGPALVDGPSVPRDCVNRTGGESLSAAKRSPSIASMSIALAQLERALQARLVPYLDLSDLPSPTLDRTEPLTRALAAAALILMGNLEDQVAARCVTDRSEDRGIDAVHVDEARSTLIVVQSKWSKDGRGSIAKGDLLKYFEGIGEMLECDWSAFHENFRKLAPRIERVLENPDLSVLMLVVTSSDTEMSRDATRAVSKFLGDLNTPGLTPMATFKQVKLSDVRAILSEHRPVDLDVTLENWGPVGEPYAAQYGVINAVDVAEWYERHGERLFTANIRHPLGRTQVNEAIRGTLLSTPEDFWYLNNGVTVLASSIAKIAKGGASRTHGSFQLRDASIVNGAQTVAAVHSAQGSDPSAVARAKVAIRFIALEACPEGFAERVTRATNTQNAVESRDFVSLDQTQSRLRDEFSNTFGKVYSVRRGEAPISADVGCSVVDATIALACSRGPGMAVVAKATIGRIWDSVGRPPYTDLFNGSTSPLQIWRAVEAMRAVDAALDARRRVSVGKERALCLQGNRLVLAVVFDLMPNAPEAMTSEEWRNVVAQLPDVTEKVVAKMCKVLALHFADNYLTALTKNASRSTELFAKTRNRMQTISTTMPQTSSRGSLG